MGSIDFALVHHANQYLITNGYQNREGLDDVLGLRGTGRGYRKIFDLHRTYGLPLNLHLSGTLLEAILWHHPDFLDQLQDLQRLGLLDLVASSYGQNIMRFFGLEHNFRQVDECLRIYQRHFGMDPETLKVFWPPERIWDTKITAPVLTDKRLPNKGHEFVLIDDRLFYPVSDGAWTRKQFDESQERNFNDFCPCRIIDGEGLTALPISRFLRLNIPPRKENSLKEVADLFHWLSEKKTAVGCPPIAIFADDLEKSAGCCSWDPEGPAQYETLLQWLAVNPWVRPVKLNEWSRTNCVTCRKSIEVGGYFEMSLLFGAGEGYEKWHCDQKWPAYRDHYLWSEARVKDIGTQGADPALLETSWKHLLASGWETAWHTPPNGVHGDILYANEPSPWAKAIASHSRHAAVIAEAAHWMRLKDRSAQAILQDLDQDGQEELILKNERLFAVFVPAFGGRLSYLFNIAGAQGKMVIGNPSDDWNWQEDLNKYMEIPANHPGALADEGCEDDRYEVVVTQSGPTVEAVLRNWQSGSRALGLEKSLRLAENSNEIEVTYRLPPGLPDLAVACGLSPDYLYLLRFGRSFLKEYTAPNIRGFSNNGVSVWVGIDDPVKAIFDPEALPREFGHGLNVRLRVMDSPVTLRIGTIQEIEP
ncbi:MAG: hypothetical protein HY892_12040 [Deltaproteobacteria bacterium]|nr:hypothetical protein [Deltaproteobacteria bacterium]